MCIWGLLSAWATGRRPLGSPANLPSGTPGQTRWDRQVRGTSLLCLPPGACMFWWVALTCPLRRDAATCRMMVSNTRQAQARPESPHRPRRFLESGPRPTAAWCPGAVHHKAIRLETITDGTSLRLRPTSRVEKVTGTSTVRTERTDSSTSAPRASSGTQRQASPSGSDLQLSGGRAGQAVGSRHFLPSPNGPERVSARSLAERPAQHPARCRAPGSG